MLHVYVRDVMNVVFSVCGAVGAIKFPSTYLKHFILIITAYFFLNFTILRIHGTSPILGERISAITLTQQHKQWLSVELNRWRSERIHCYF